MTIQQFTNLSQFKDLQELTNFSYGDISILVFDEYFKENNINDQTFEYYARKLIEQIDVIEKSFIRIPLPIDIVKRANKQICIIKFIAACAVESYLFQANKDSIDGKGELKTALQELFKTIISKVLYCVIITKATLGPIKEGQKKHKFFELLNFFQEAKFDLIDIFLKETIINDLKGSNVSSLFWVSIEDPFLINHLVKYGINIKNIDENGNSLLHLSIARNNVSLINYSLLRGIDINETNIKGKTALHYISKAHTGKNTVILRHLISKGADINISDCKGNTPLTLAIKNKKFNTVYCLLQNGASIENLNIENIYGNPKEENRFYEIRKLLAATKIIDEYISGQTELPINIIFIDVEELTSDVNINDYQDLQEARITSEDECEYKVELNFFINRFKNFVKNNGIFGIYQTLKLKIEESRFNENTKEELISFLEQTLQLKVEESSRNENTKEELTDFLRPEGIGEITDKDSETQNIDLEKDILNLFNQPNFIVESIGLAYSTE